MPAVLSKLVVSTFFGGFKSHPLRHIFPLCFFPSSIRANGGEFIFAATPASYLLSPVPQLQMPWPLPSCFIMEHSVDRTAACAVLSALVAKSDSVT